MIRYWLIVELSGQACGPSWSKLLGRGGDYECAENHPCPSLSRNLVLANRIITGIRHSLRMPACSEVAPGRSAGARRQSRVDSSQ